MLHQNHGRPLKRKNCKVHGLVWVMDGSNVTWAALEIVSGALEQSYGTLPFFITTITDGAVIKSVPSQP